MRLFLNCKAPPPAFPQLYRYPRKVGVLRQKMFSEDLCKVSAGLCEVVMSKDVDRIFDGIRRNNRLIVIREVGGVQSS